MNSDLLVPVPLHTERVAQRGYNQSALLASVLSAEISIPVREDILFRNRPTVSQTQLTREERWTNVQDAFTCLDDQSVSGRQVTLIDDVATTGATLEACAVALLAQGARTVSAFTLAHAV